MAKPSLTPCQIFVVMFFAQIMFVKSTWCVARSDASEQSLQNALDYACFSGADCAPILENGLCFLPNTIQAHASFAFNGFYQRMNRAPGSCDFAGTATIAKTDPSKSFFSPFTFVVILVFFFWCSLLALECDCRAQCLFLCYFVFCTCIGA